MQQYLASCLQQPQQRSVAALLDALRVKECGQACCGLFLHASELPGFAASEAGMVQQGTGSTQQQQQQQQQQPLPAGTHCAAGCIIMLRTIIIVIAIMVLPIMLLHVAAAGCRLLAGTQPVPRAGSCRKCLRHSQACISIQFLHFLSLFCAHQDKLLIELCFTRAFCLCHCAHLPIAVFNRHVY
jgi:hypothetical protein